MFIGPFRGYGFEQPATALLTYGLYQQMEWAPILADEALLVGSLLAYSLTDNTAVTGIMRETRGLRVNLFPALGAGTQAHVTHRAAGVSLTAVAALPNPNTYAAVRGPQIVAQVYGPHASIKVDTDASGNILAGSLLVPSPDVAGKVNGPATEATPTQNEANKAVGYSFEIAAINTVTSVKGFVMCLNTIGGP